MEHDIRGPSKPIKIITPHVLTRVTVYILSHSHTYTEMMHFYNFTFQIGGTRVRNRTGSIRTAINLVRTVQSRKKKILEKRNRTRLVQPVIVIFLENSENVLNFTTNSKPFGEFLNILGFSQFFRNFLVFSYTFLNVLENLKKFKNKKSWKIIENFKICQIYLIFL